MTKIVKKIKNGQKDVMIKIGKNHHNGPKDQNNQKWSN